MCRQASERTVTGADCRVQGVGLVGCKLVYGAYLTVNDIEYVSVRLAALCMVTHHMTLEAADGQYGNPTGILRCAWHAVGMPSGNAGCEMVVTDTR